jgi:Zn-dependent protease with chaperone function
MNTRGKKFPLPSWPPSHHLRKILGVALVILLTVSVAWADRTRLKPPWNMFSPQTDIQVGKQAAEEMKKQLPLCNDPKVDQYLTQLGMRLVARLPKTSVQYPWEFHCVNDKAVNAFALPGGYVFVNRGTIEAADTEAQLAGVMAHELSHVVLRHGTSQASKAQLAQGAAGIVGGLFGGSAGGALLSEGVSLGTGTILLRYSRSAETQADVLGTQTVYDAGYDPRGMAQFFEKLQAESKGKNPPQFLSDHPNPGNRLERVNQEIDKLGGAPSYAKRDSSEFQAVKREVLQLPVVKKAPRPATGAANPQPPSQNAAEYQGRLVTFKYPDNWQKSEDPKGGASFVPHGGVVQGSDGQSELAFGMIVAVQQAQVNPKDENGLSALTQQIIKDMQQSNPHLRVAGQASPITVDGQPGLSTHLTNDSPAGGREIDWLVTVARPEGVVYFLCVAPESSWKQYEKVFSDILNGARFAQ